MASTVALSRLKRADTLLIRSEPKSPAFQRPPPPLGERPPKAEDAEPEPAPSSKSPTPRPESTPQGSPIRTPVAFRPLRVLSSLERLRANSSPAVSRPHENSVPRPGQDSPGVSLPRRNSPLLTVRAKTTGRRPRLPAEPWIGGQTPCRKSLNEYEYALLSSFAPQNVMDLFTEETSSTRARFSSNSRHMIVAVRARGGLECEATGLIKFCKDNDSELELCNGESETLRMKFDKIYTESASQRDVYFSLIKPYLKSLVDMGGEGAVLAYGMTGSGKTFTIQGIDQNPGMTTRIFRQIFHEDVQKDQSETKDTCTDCERLADQYRIFVSMIELYMEQPKDLLQPPNQPRLREMPDGSLHWEGLRRVEVNSSEDAELLIKEGRSHCQIGGTSLNERSSRSHLLTLIDMEHVDDARRRPRLWMVDLAGNEKIGKSQTSGLSLNETRKINQSLSSFALVMQALGKDLPQTGSRRMESTISRRGSSAVRAKASTHIPFRNSLLTRALQSVLSSALPIVLIVTISREPDHVSETIASLRFAQECQRIVVHRKCNPERINSLETWRSLSRKLCEVLAQQRSMSH